MRGGSIPLASAITTVTGCGNQQMLSMQNLKTSQTITEDGMTVMSFSQQQPPTVMPLQPQVTLRTLVLDLLGKPNES